MHQLLRFDAHPLLNFRRLCLPPSDKPIGGFTARLHRWMTRRLLLCGRLADRSAAKRRSLREKFQSSVIHIFRAHSRLAPIHFCLLRLSARIRVSSLSVLVVVVQSVQRVVRACLRSRAAAMRSGRPGAASPLPLVRNCGRVPRHRLQAQPFRSRGHWQPLQINEGRLELCGIFVQAFQCVPHSFSHREGRNHSPQFMQRNVGVKDVLERFETNRV